MSSPEPLERLQRLLGGAPLQALRQRLRSRYELGMKNGDVVTLGKLADVERAALCGILGRRVGVGASMRIDLAELDAVLRHGELADSLRDALEILDGPIVNRIDERSTTQQRWDSLRSACSDPRLAALIGESKGLGLLKRLAGSDPDLAGRLCGAAQRVLSQLPALGGAVARSHLAADILGDAHALDQGRPVASLVLAALRKRIPEDAETTSEGDETAREMWASAGVLVNELARPVLFLNLLGQLGEPCYLSLRALLRVPPVWDCAGRTVFVCENPNLVAIAADALGTRCAPLVCTDGMPAAAQRTLLLQLKAAGARLLYHGDFDWPGIGIGNVVMRQFGALPWRYQAQDYRAAVAVATMGPDWRPLGAAAIGAQWDANLSAEMSACQRAIDEEAVAHTLLQDLDTPCQAN